MSTAYERLLNDIKDAKYSSCWQQTQLANKLKSSENFAGNFLKLISDGVEMVDPISLAIVIFELQGRIEELEYRVSTLEDQMP